MVNLDLVVQIKDFEKVMMDIIKVFKRDNFYLRADECKHFERAPAYVADSG